MSTLPDHEPACSRSPCSSIELEIAAHERDLGGFTVRRVLPAPLRRHVGPFVFFDHMGPATFEIGKGIDVRPHPHIALATVTFLFDGEILHRDSLGSAQLIRPGDVNWMLAGSGIAHSERTSPEERKRGARVHGIQSWVGLPLAHEDDAPFFMHHPASTIPRIMRDGVRIDVIAGTAFGARSPVRVASPTLYVHADLDAGATLALDTEHAERGAYVVSGELACAGHALREGTLAVFREGEPVTLTATTAARVMIIGGAKLDGERHVWWNFVASTEARIERAKSDWKNGRFAKVVGDEEELIPLPE